MNAGIRLALISFLLLLPAGNTQGQNPFTEESAAQSDLRESAFRYMFKHYNYGSSVKFFCIQPERTLPEKFLRRFAGNQPPVVWANDCDFTGPMNSIRNKKTGERGMRMSLQEINWISRHEAEVKVEAFSDGIAANWDTLKINFKDDHWFVIGDLQTAVS